GEKVAAVTPKPQTTRDRILGVAKRPGAQLAFLDTPGVHRPHRPLNEHMVKLALEAMSTADVTLLVVDATAPPARSGDEDALVLAALRGEAKPRTAVAAVNKIDALADKSALLPLLEALAAAFPFRAIVPISATGGEGVEALVKELVALLPEGPPLFPGDEYTDRPVRYLAAEIIREKIFQQTGEEIPYSSAVTVERWDEPAVPGRATRVTATIHVERDSQKGIVIGKAGARLKKIGTEARREIEAMIGGKVMLDLVVRTEENWTRDPQRMRKLGYGE
ncbi:MAG TPA: GTPase Era, partial [Myxococcota bacterium]|nr:GTPase Era [Myxococcota bacterium]